MKIKVNKDMIPAFKSFSDYRNILVKRALNLKSETST